MYADQIDNDLRRLIFLELCKNESLTYSELKPNGIESNQFAYHLKKLKDDGFIEKADRVYRLAPKGLRLADHLSFKTEFIREQPKSIIILVAMSSRGKKLLVGKRKRQPHIGKLVLPGGKMHFGEEVEDAAKRTALEFLPKLESKPVRVGSAYVKFSKNKTCYSHIYSEVFVVEVDVNETELSKSDGGTHDLFWWDLNNGFDELWLEGSKEIFKAINTNKELFNMSLQYNE